MANNFDIRSFGAARKPNWLDNMAQSAFAGFLLLILVGLSPFSSSETLTAGAVATGEGDLVRQLTFIIAFVVILALAFAIRGPLALKAFPISLIIVMIWCFLSIGWAIEPGIAARRAVLSFILVACVMLSVDTLGAPRALHILRIILAGILIVDCVSLVLISQSVHQPGELESELAGNWRGLHNHKNLAGPIAALSALLFFHHALAERRLIDWALFVAAVVFMVGTQSKTVIGFFPVTLALSVTYRQMTRTESGRQIYMVMFVGLLVFVTIGWVAFYETIAELMSDPTSFTGRVAIWQKVFTYVESNPFFGAGYGSFWGVGGTSPASGLNPNEKWIEIIPHSHNGYLEILVTTGAIGLVLSVIAFVILPIKRLLSPDDINIDLKALLFSLVCFFVFENLLETIYLNRERPEWVIFLIVLAILHQMPAKSAERERPLQFQNRSWRHKGDHSRR